MNGHYNFYVGQQIFYLYNEQQIKGLISDNEQTKKLNNDNYVIEPDIGKYRLDLRRLNWNNARQVCVQEGGNRNICDIINVEQTLPIQLPITN